MKKYILFPYLVSLFRDFQIDVSHYIVHRGYIEVFIRPSEIILMDNVLAFFSVTLHISYSVGIGNGMFYMIIERSSSLCH